MIDMQTCTVTLPDGTQVTPLGGSLTIDNTWSPFCQGTIQIAAEGVNLATLDPRVDAFTSAAHAPRVKARIVQQFADTQAFADLSTQWGGGTFAALSARYGAGKFSDWSADVTRNLWGNAPTSPAAQLRPGRELEAAEQERCHHSDRPLG